MKPPFDDSRRTFLRQGIALLAGLSAARLLPAQDPSSAARGEVMTVSLGNRQLPASRLGLAGWQLGEKLDEDAAVELVRHAHRIGVRYFETAHGYGGRGRGEQRLARGLERVRGSVFLAGKTFRREASAAERELDESLGRLGTSLLELWMFQEVSSLDAARAILAPGGAAGAARKALADGRIRMLGATSHSSPEGLNHLIEHLPELSVIQCPINCLDPHYHSFIRETIPLAVERKVSVLGTRFLADGALERIHPVARDEALRYAFSQPFDVWVSHAESPPELDAALAALRTLAPMTREEQENLLRRTAPFSGPSWEPYKQWDRGE